MELLEIENIDYSEQTLEAVFDGLFETGFYVNTDFDYDKEQVEWEDERTGARDYFNPENITFWNFVIYNTDEEEITINDRELKKIKQQIEFKLIDLLKDYINNN